jgi:hypothetical protein
VPAIERDRVEANLRDFSAGSARWLTGFYPAVRCASPLFAIAAVQQLTCFEVERLRHQRLIADEYRLLEVFPIATKCRHRLEEWRVQCVDVDGRPHGAALFLFFFRSTTQMSTWPTLPGLADAYNLLGSYGEMPMREANERAKAAAQKAVDLDDQVAEGHTCAIIAGYDWEWAKAERHFQRAIDLKPRYAIAHEWYSEYLSWMARHDRPFARRGRRSTSTRSLFVRTRTSGWLSTERGSTMPQ